MPYGCILKLGDVEKVPLDFEIKVPDCYVRYAFPCSSMATKGLVCELPPMDSGCRREIHVIISNVSGTLYLERVRKFIPARCTPHFAVYLALIRSTLGHRLEILTTQWCVTDRSRLRFLSGWNTRANTLNLSVYFEQN